MTNKQRLSVWVGIATIAISLCYLVWRAMLLVPPNTVRVWALLTTLALPVVAWAGWWFGNTEARGRLAGIDQAVDKVMVAATRAAGLRGVVTQQSPFVALPEPEIVHRQLPRGSDVVEL